MTFVEVTRGQELACENQEHLQVKEVANGNR